MWNSDRVLQHFERFESKHAFEIRMLINLKQLMGPQKTMSVGRVCPGRGKNFRVYSGNYEEARFRALLGSIRKI